MSRNTCARPRTFVVGLVVAVLVLGTALLSPRAASADTVNTFYVQIVSATQPYGLPPLFEAQPLPGYGGLPPGTSLEGHATCSQVYDTGTSGPIESAYGTSAGPLAPGTYQFVTSSCASDPAYPLTLSGTSGQYNLALYGGPYTVTKANTVVGGVGREGPISGSAPTSVSLEAVVLDSSNEAQTGLAGQRISFSYELANGVWNVNVCSAVTADDGHGNVIAQCTLSSTDITGLYQGTGKWTATYAGNADYTASSFTGQLTGETTAAQAAQSLAAIAKSNTGVTLVAQYVPPECDNPAKDIDSDSLIGVSLSELSCSQLQVLQTVVGVVLGLVVPGEEGTGEALEIADVIAYNAAVDEANAFKQAWLDSLEVSDPTGGRFINPDTI